MTRLATSKKLHFPFVPQHPALMGPLVNSGESVNRYKVDLSSPYAEELLGNAELVVPKDYPLGSAYIRVSKNKCLRVPHVERDGKVCFTADVGPLAGLNPQQRIDELIQNFFVEFVLPLQKGELNGDFEKEIQTYWELHATSQTRSVAAISKILLSNLRPDLSIVFEAPLLLPSRYLLASNDRGFCQRVKDSLGPRASRIENIVVAHLRIEYDYSPVTWPKNVADIESILIDRLGTADLIKWNRFKKHRKNHRVVILSSARCSYGFLLPGGPSTLVEKGRFINLYPTLKVVPLVVSRVDASWTYGRDKHPAVLDRQNQHVLVLGCGALGSPVIDQLARAGVGKISIVDPDVLEAPNVGRHLLGLGSLGRKKTQEVARAVTSAHPACHTISFSLAAQGFLSKIDALEGVDMIVDLTGEPSVRAAVDAARISSNIPLIIGWMEPYAAAAHVCQLTGGTLWANNGMDRMKALQAIDWPDDVMSQEPACNSKFQAYTASAAAHAVALVAEACLELLDGTVMASRMFSWVKGRQFLDDNYPGLELANWASKAEDFDGVVIQRAWE